MGMQARVGSGLIFDNSKPFRYHRRALYIGLLSLNLDLF